MSPEATAVYLREFKAAAIANTPNLPARLIYTSSCLPVKFDDSQIDDALVAINAGMASTSPAMNGYAVMMAPKLGKAAGPLVARLAGIVQNGGRRRWPTSMAFYAIVQLAEINDDARRAYLDAFDSPDPSLRLDALRYAPTVRWRDDALGEHLVMALGDSSTQVRDQAAYVIMQLYPAGCEAAAMLRVVLRSEHPEVLQAVIGDLAARCQSDDVVAGVGEMLRRPSGEWIGPALIAAGHLRSAGQPLLPLLRHLQEPGAFRGDPELVRDAIDSIETALHPHAEPGGVLDAPERGAGH
jgi:hypothetical protein